MAVHGTERGAERARDYARTEMMMLAERCNAIEVQLKETELRLKRLEKFVSEQLPDR